MRLHVYHLCQRSRVYSTSLQLTLLTNQDMTHIQLWRYHVYAWCRPSKLSGQRSKVWARNSLVWVILQTACIFLSYDSNNIEISWGVQIMISEAEAFISRSLFISPHHLDWCDIHLHPPKASRKNWINITYAWLCQWAWRTDARNWHFR